LDFQARNNNELVAVLGNFINRVFVLCHKYWGGKVPKQNNLDNIDLMMIEKLENCPRLVGELIEKYKFRAGLQAVMELARAGNKYLADTEPWKLFKHEDKKGRTETILNTAIQVVATLATVCEPFMPFTAKKLSKMLVIENGDWNSEKTIRVNEGHILNKPELLFSIVDDKVIQKQINKLKKN